MKTTKDTGAAVREFAAWLQNFENTLIDAVEDHIDPFLMDYGDELDERWHKDLARIASELCDYYGELQTVWFNNLRPLLKRLPESQPTRKASPALRQRRLAKVA